MPHIHEKIDFTVEVYIVHENKVLLRKHDKYKIWLSIGGHIELHEDPIEALIREVREEVGLEISIYDRNKDNNPPAFSTSDYKELITPMFRNRHRINPTHEHVTESHFAYADSDKVRPATYEQQGEWKWFSREDLLDPQYQIKPHIRHYALSALETLSR